MREQCQRWVMEFRGNAATRRAATGTGTGVAISDASGSIRVVSGGVEGLDGTRGWLVIVSRERHDAGSRVLSQ